MRIPLDRVPHSSSCSERHAGARGAEKTPDPAQMLVAIGTAYAKAADRPAARDTLSRRSNRPTRLRICPRGFTPWKTSPWLSLSPGAVGRCSRPCSMPSKSRKRSPTHSSEARHESYIVRTFSRADDLETALWIVRDLPESNRIRAIALGYALEGLKQFDERAVKRFRAVVHRDGRGRSDRTRWAECMQGIAVVLADVGEIRAAQKIADDLDMAAAEFGPE